jgi:exopolyphosphatase/guanosine-5'-triphosphate,3'-diphosphate pyrophosphatase
MNVEAIRHETGVLLVRHEVEPEHTLHVAKLADQLLTGLTPLHQLGEEDRVLLGCAAMLHDIGWAITQPDGKGHHKASACMIREYQWTSLDREQVRLVAVIARYHRKSQPKEANPEFSTLGTDMQKRARWLAACLRVADGLDRRHLQIVDSVTVSPLDEGVEIVARSSREISEELRAARKKGDLLESLVGGRVLFRRES